jgi:hypothetical protein
LGLYDYGRTDAHPAFNLVLRVNFVNGAGENSGFKFTGSEGVMTIGNGVTLGRLPKEPEPGYTIGTFAKAEQERFQKEYRKQYPRKEPSVADAVPFSEERYYPPRGYNDHTDHFANFFDAVRSRKPVVEDALFGLRAAAPALLSNLSYFQGRILEWDPVNTRVKA